MRNKINILLIIVVLLFASCQSNPVDKSLDNSYHNIDSTVVTLSNEENDSLRSLYSPIDEIQKNLVSDTEYIKNNGNIFKFENLSDVQLPQITSFNVISIDTRNNDIQTISEGISEVEKCLSVWYPNGLKGTFVADNLRYAGEISDTQNGNWALVYSMLNDKSIDGATMPGNPLHIIAKDFHIQLGFRGIYSMAIGEMSALMGRDIAVFGTWSKIEKYYFSNEYPSAEYRLYGGNYTMKQADEFVKEYLLNDFPCEVANNITFDVPEIGYFQLPDESYGFVLNVRRVYNQIPFDYFKYGVNNTSFGNKKYFEDMTEVYMIRPNKIDNFVGAQFADIITPVGETYTEMISLKTAVNILEEKYAKEMRVSVERISLVYELTNNNPENPYAYEDITASPAWRFDGINLTNNKAITVYVNALTGECRHRNINSTD